MNTTDLLDVEYLDVAPEAFPAPREKAAGMIQLLPPGGARAGGGWTYFWNAAILPANLLTLFGVMLFSMTSRSNLVGLGALGVEAVFLVLVPHWRSFRRRVDACLDDDDRADMERARERLILQMGEVHQRELAQIDALLDKSFANAQRQRDAVPLGAGDALGMARLTLSYIHLAITYRACAESLAMTDHGTLLATICSLEAAEAAQPEPARPIFRRWLSIAQRRAECWSRARDQLETTGHQLATITELVHLLHQESLAPSCSASLSAEVDSVLADFEHGEGAERELAGLGLDDTDTFLVHAIAAGPAALARRDRGADRRRDRNSPAGT